MKPIYVKRITALIFSLLISATLTITLAQNQQKTFTVNKGDKLKVSSSFGNITYNISSSAEVKVIAKNIISDELHLLQMEKSGSTIKVKFKGEDSDNFAFEIYGPSTLDLDFSTGGGNIAITGNIDGSVYISTAGGNISTADINGKADISTAGGNIEIKNVNGSIDVSTAGGDMNFGNINGKADISTAGGNIKVGSINKSAEISTGGGNISVNNIGGDAEMSTGGGNIKIEQVTGSAEISTGGGNISLASASGKIEASTGAGNIKLNNIKGYVEGSTGAGNIYAEIYPDGKKESELSTGIGNITLLVPPTAKVTIIATVRVIMWDEEEQGLQNIQSDFKPTSVNKNRKKKKIEAKFELNGGGPLIDLSTGMGDIEIKKLK
jgi:hypothetical protein